MRLREVGTVTGDPLTEATATVRLKAPPEGVVSRAFVSALQGGPAVRSLRGGRRIFAHFPFAARPKAGRALTTAWTRNGSPVGVVVRKPASRTVIAFIGRPGGRLPPGLYRCGLRVGTRVVAVAVIRLV